MVLGGFGWFRVLVTTIAKPQDIHKRATPGARFKVRHRLPLHGGNRLLTLIILFDANIRHLDGRGWIHYIVVFRTAKHKGLFDAREGKKSHLPNNHP